MTASEPDARIYTISALMQARALARLAPLQSHTRAGTIARMSDRTVILVGVRTAP